MLTELSVVEQRYLAVREALDGAKITDVATRYGVDRRTVHRWLLRYANEGLGALADRSSRPDRCPHQIAPEIAAGSRERRARQWSTRGQLWIARCDKLTSGVQQRRLRVCRDAVRRQRGNALPRKR